MGFLPEHVNPVLVTFAAMGFAATVNTRRWWLVGVPALIGLAIGVAADVANLSVHLIPLVPFVVEIATVATFGWLVLGRRTAATR